MIKILIGGSPCTHWSIVRQKKKTRDGLRETIAEGLGWELFLNYIIAKEKFKPDYFLYENNESISRQIQEQIRQELRIENLAHFNSSKVSAQNRKRIYGTNVLDGLNETQACEEYFYQDIPTTAIAQFAFCHEKKCTKCA